MQQAMWIKLLNLIPPELSNSLALMTKAGQEVSVHSVLRTEDDYLVLRGRLTGTTDGGRVFFVPYEQIIYLGFQKPVTEAEVAAMYGEELPASVPLPEPAAQEAPPPEPQPEPEPAAAAPEPEPAPPPARTPAAPVRANMAGLLERIRARQQPGAARSA